MNKEVSISARITNELSEQLSLLSNATGRSKSWVINEALRAYLKSETAFLDAVEEGMQDIEKGRMISHDEVMREIREKISKAQR